MSTAIFDAVQQCFESHSMQNKTLEVPVETNRVTIPLAKVVIRALINGVIKVKRTRINSKFSQTFQRKLSRP